MELYQIWAIVCLLFLFAEMMTPSLFFLNLSLGCAVAGIFGYYDFSYTVQIWVFVIVSILCLIILRPILLNNKKKSNVNSVIEGKYIGLEAIVVEDIKENDTGKIKVFDEIWSAKSITGEVLLAGLKVKIVKNESLTMFVENIKEEK